MDIWKESLKQAFPLALSMDRLTRRVRIALANRGFTLENTIFATSLCRDELNQRFENILKEHWEANFRLGGLGGFPFAGLTGMKAMNAHRPDQGHVVIAYGPHIGIDKKGLLGRSHRRSLTEPTTCCGALTATVNAFKEGNAPAPAEVYDAEREYLAQALEPFKKGILESDAPIMTGTESMYQVIDEAIYEMVEATKPKFKVVFLGGVLINTPVAAGDYFAPRKATIIDYSGSKRESIDWMQDLLEDVTQIDQIPGIS